MTELHRVRPPGRSFAGHERVAVVLVIGGVLLAIAKPWGSTAERPIPTPSAAAIATAVPSGLSTTPDGEFRFDPDMFGPFEPAPDWSIWPAGYFISVQYVTRAPGGRAVASPAVPPPSADPTLPSPGVTSPNPGSPSPPPPTDPGPNWPAMIDVGPGDHLLWLGINTPRGWTVGDWALSRADPDGSLVDVEVRRLPSKWDDHFTVLSLPAVAGSDGLADWPAGDYRLELSVSPGDIMQTIRIVVRTDVGPETPLPAEPGRSRGPSGPPA